MAGHLCCCPRDSAPVCGICGKGRSAHADYDRAQQARNMAREDPLKEVTHEKSSMNPGNKEFGVPWKSAWAIIPKLDYSTVIETSSV